MQRGRKDTELVDPAAEPAGRSSPPSSPTPATGPPAASSSSSPPTSANPNTRAAYAQAVAQFLRWAEERGLTLRTIEPIAVAAYVEELKARLAAPSVKQHLAAIRMLFDWLVTGQVLPINPAASVKAPKHVVKKGKTPVLSAEDARTLLDSIATEREHDDGTRTPSSSGSGTGPSSASWSSASPASRPSSA